MAINLTASLSRFFSTRIRGWQCLHIILITAAIFCTESARARNTRAVVADSLTHAPLPNASIFDRNGKLIATADHKGTLPYISLADYPLTIRYMGYYEMTIPTETTDTLLMRENPATLPEVVVETRQQKALHILAYVREYSTLSTYTDTVALFREKMVDFMLPVDKKTSFKGWRHPRVLNSRSYYHFTNASGLDSVSDRCNNHFTWSDWVGILPPTTIPAPLADAENSTYTLPGKYLPTEIWTRKGDKISIDIDVMADTTSRKWMPEVAAFAQKGNMEFEQLRLHLNYNSVSEGIVSPVDLTGYSFNIDSRGRGHSMFRFNRRDEPFFVSTYSEVYLLDKEYITVKEARKWERNKPHPSEIGIYEAPEAPELQDAVLKVIARVEAIDHDMIRQEISGDKLLKGKERVKRNFGQDVLQRLKNIFGISYAIGKRKQSRHWHDFEREQILKNNQKLTQSDQ